jgi:hypothetical protein
MHEDVKFIANLFVREALDIFYRYFVHNLFRPAASQESPWSLDDLSFIEQGRLFRPLYRIIMFGNLLGVNSSDPGTTEDLSEYFLCRFPSWQVEEISCFNDFITNQTIRKWHEMEDHVFNRLAADPKILKFRGNEQALERHLSGKIWTKTLRMSYYMDFLVIAPSLPIKDMRALFEAQRDTLENLFTSYFTGSDPEIMYGLHDALLVDPRYFMTEIDGDVYVFDEYEDGIGPGQKVFEKDDLMSFTYWWQWSHHTQAGSDIYYNSTSNQDELPELEGFRRMRYSFWD